MFCAIFNFQTRSRCEEEKQVLGRTYLCYNQLQIGPEEAMTEKAGNLYAR